MEETNEFKRCSKCKTLKEVSSFYKNRVFFDGYNNQCKSCKVSNFEHQRVKCECGKNVLKFYMKDHLKTRLHFKTLKQLEKAKTEIKYDF
jgi:hypothetical protein